MRTRRLFFCFFALALTALGAACADQEPEFGLPSAIKGKSPTGGAGGSTSSGSTSGGTDGGGAATGAKAFFLASVATPARAECGTSCHRPSPGPKLFGDTPDETYTVFIQMNFHTAPNFRDKGQHTGPGISANLKGVVGEWMLKEQAERGGSSGATDAGGGG